MKTSLVIASCLSLALGTACNKGEGSGGAAASDSNPCTFHHPNPKFCLAPPSGFVADAEKAVSDETKVTFGNGNDFLVVTWRTKPDPDGEDMLAKSYKENESKNGTVFTDDGKGGYWYDGVKKGGPTGSYHLVGANVKLPTGGRVSCLVNGGNDAQAKGFLAACRSLRAE